MLVKNLDMVTWLRPADSEDALLHWKVELQITKNFIHPKTTKGFLFQKIAGVFEFVCFSIRVSKKRSVRQSKICRNPAISTRRKIDERNRITRKRRDTGGKFKWKCDPSLSPPAPRSRHGNPALPGEKRANYYFFWWFYEISHKTLLHSSGRLKAAAVKLDCFAKLSLQRSLSSTTSRKSKHNEINFEDLNSISAGTRTRIYRVFKYSLMDSRLFVDIRQKTQHFFNNKKHCWLPIATNRPRKPLIL